MSFSVDGNESKYVALLLNDYSDSAVLIVNLQQENTGKKGQPPSTM